MIQFWYSFTFFYHFFLSYFLVGISENIVKLLLFFLFCFFFIILWLDLIWFCLKMCQHLDILSTFCSPLPPLFIYRVLFAVYFFSFDTRSLRFVQKKKKKGNSKDNICNYTIIDKILSSTIVMRIMKIKTKIYEDTKRLFDGYIFFVAGEIQWYETWCNSVAVHFIIWSLLHVNMTTTTQ